MSDGPRREGDEPEPETGGIELGGTDWLLSQLNDDDEGEQPSAEVSDQNTENSGDRLASVPEESAVDVDPDSTVDETGIATAVVDATGDEPLQIGGSPAAGVDVPTDEAALLSWWEEELATTEIPSTLVPDESGPGQPSDAEEFAPEAEASVIESGAAPEPVSEPDASATEPSAAELSPWWRSAVSPAVPADEESATGLEPSAADMLDHDETVAGLVSVGPEPRPETDADDRGDDWLLSTEYGDDELGIREKVESELEPNHPPLFKSPASGELRVVRPLVPEEGSEPDDELFAWSLEPNDGLDPLIHGSENTDAAEDTLGAAPLGGVGAAAAGVAASSEDPVAALDVDGLDGADAAPESESAESAADRDDDDAGLASLASAVDDGVAAIDGGSASEPEAATAVFSFAADDANEPEPLNEPESLDETAPSDLTTPTGGEHAAPSASAATAETDPETAVAPQRKTPWTLIWVAIGLVAVLVIAGLFFLGTRLPGLLAAPTPSPTPTATATETPTPTPTPSEVAVLVGPVAPGEHKWNELLGGECLDPYANPWAETFTVVDCAAPHAAQMVHTASINPDPAAPYPGEQTILSQIYLWCSAPGVLDLAAAGAFSDLQVQGSYPVNEEQWAAGERNFFCFVNRSGGEGLTGSLAVPPSAT